jgi:hypothetical protein
MMTLRARTARQMAGVLITMKLSWMLTTRVREHAIQRPRRRHPIALHHPQHLSRHAALYERTSASVTVQVHKPYFDEMRWFKSLVHANVEAKRIMLD